MSVLKWMAMTALGFTLLACGGGGSGSDSGPAGSGNDIPVFALDVQGRHIVKLTANGSKAWVGLAEKAGPFENTTTPERQLFLSTEDGRGQLPAYIPPAGWSLIDFSVHPSRQISVVLATDKRLRLLRLGPGGELLREQEFLDAAAATDPIVGGPFPLMDSKSLVPSVTRDAARLSALGEDVAIAFRNGRSAVVLHRLSYTASAGFDKRWRGLVAPGVFIGASLPMSGSFDPFKSVDHMWRLALDIDAQGRIAIALSLTHTDLADGHADYFGEAIDPTASNGFLISRFSADGQRLYSVLKNSVARAEVHGLRWVGDCVAVVGRARSVQAPDGWNGFVSLLNDSNRTLSYELIDVDQGEVIFDIAAMTDGQLLASGAAGYTQNPTGASISEAAAPLLVQLASDGKLVKRISLPTGQRHNQLRTVLAWQGGWLLGGMENGPGTHSADGNESLMRSDGYLREQRELGF